jgi:hypothetical protein
MQLPSAYQVTLLKNDSVNKEWMIKNGSDSLMVQYVTEQDTSISDTLRYGYDTNRLLSVYDMYLSVNELEKKEYSITYTDIDRYKARIVRRTFVSQKQFLEISLKHLCNKPSALQITGYDISGEAAETIMEGLKSIRLNCN